MMLVLQFCLHVPIAVDLLNCLETFGRFCSI
jgi:hypothetical protein